MAFEEPRLMLRNLSWYCRFVTSGPLPPNTKPLVIGITAGISDCIRWLPVNSRLRSPAC